MYLFVKFYLTRYSLINLNLNIVYYVLVQFEAIFESSTINHKSILLSIILVNMYCLSISNNIIIDQTNIYLLYLFILTLYIEHIPMLFALFVFCIIIAYFYFYCYCYY